MSDTTDFSAIKFFKLFEDALAAYNTFPLVPENVAVQQDAYKRLATHEEGEESFEIFASFECGKKTKDSDMRFGIDFTSTAFVFHVEGVASAVFAYTACFKDEKDAALQLMLTLKLMASGQICCLITERNGQYCAKSSIPQVLTTDTNFPLRWRKKDVTGYETMLLKNSLIMERLAVPKVFFLIDCNAEGEIVPKGREFTSAELTPLTKRDFSDASDEVIMRESGKRPEETGYQLLLRSFEYWLLVVILLAIVYGGAFLGIVPSVVAEHPTILLPVTWILCGLIILPLLAKKEQLKVYAPEHWWVRLDTSITEGFRKRTKRFTRSKGQPPEESKK